MWHVRKKLAKRRIALTLLLAFLQSVFSPLYTFALTTGPHQPEYISFADPGSTDMVDLLTGDFSFNLPVLEVPGPEGGFSLPLSYSAGLGLDQESSWVGLGWTLNAGSITRSINEYPDDANGEPQIITVKDLTGLRGWDASLLGVGRMGWNNQAGHYGSVSILGIVNAEWSEGHTSVGVAGFNVTDDGAQVNPAQLGIALATVVSWGAAAAAALEVGKSASEAVAKQIAIGSVVGVASDGLFSLAGGGNSPNAPTAGYWQYSKTEKKNFGLKLATGFLLNVSEYRIWLDQTRSERMYGSLYLGNSPVTTFSGAGNNAQVYLKNGGVTETLHVFSNANNEGSASDINYQSHPSDDQKEFYEINNPVALAPDLFSVKAAGISGTIKPYRLDVGSVSMPRQMTKYHDRMAPVQYVTNDANYKVPFVYNGQLSGNYFHHVGGASAVSTPTFYFGINTILGNANPSLNTSLTYDLNDVVFKNQRIRSDLNTYKKIPQSNYIEWLSNDEIRSSMTYSSKFMDYFSGGTGSTVSPTSDRYLSRSNLPFGSMVAYTYTASLSGTIPVSASDIGKFSVNDIVDLNISIYDDATEAENGSTSDYQSIPNVTVTAVHSSTPYSITVNDSRVFPFYNQIANVELDIHKTPQSLSSIGGFCITAVDGTTYHFALPVYDYEQYTEIRDVSDPNNKKSIIKRIAPFANTWLLTAITGADFIDRNSNGMVDDGDWGQWTKLNYGIHLNDYKWRLPYSGYKKLPGDTHDSFTEGKKQLIYLNSIETRSHVALFLKGNRSDGKSANTSVSQYPLKLDEIMLLSKEHYRKMVTPTAQGGYGLPDFSSKSNYLLMSSSINTATRNFLNQNCLKRILFTYTYDLAQNTSNSTASGGGKLTLSRLSMLGRVSRKIVPDYLFEYGNNPAYNENYWDGFGMYNPSGNSSSGSHSPSSTDSDGSAWSLTKITTPLGAEISINYERDTYYSISGQIYSNQGPSFSNLNYNVYYPTGIPIHTLTISNPSNYFEVGDSVRIDGYATYSCSNSPGTQNTTFTKDARIVAIGSNYIDVGVDYMNLNCNLTSSGQYIHFDAQAGQVFQPLKNRKGGDVRVGSIVMKDEFENENKIRYLYQNDDGTSSGVLAKLPEYVSGPYYDFYDYLGYPQTPVLYRRVTILGGKLTTDADFSSRHVYEFETPRYSQFSLAQTVIKENELIAQGALSTDKLSVFWNKYEDRTSIIGRLKSVKIYDKDANLYTSSTLTYTDQILNSGTNNYQGVYTEGALMFDRVGDFSIAGTKYHKLNRTTFIHYPSVVKEIVNSKDGFTSESENLSWDPYTGNVLEKVEKDPLGLYVKSVIRPAYTVYPELGSKALNPLNKNMLSQEAASYAYRSDAVGSQISLLNASAQLWKKDWSNYRIYSTGTQTFSDGSEGDDVWRKGGTYIWKGDYSRLRPDGSMTFSPSDEYNFAGSNPLWQYLGEPGRYDHYSLALESKDLNNIYSSVKMGYDNRKAIASASNAEFNEIAFSSGEDLQFDKPFFGGEVALGSGTVLYKSKGQIIQANTNDPNITGAHSGDAIVSLTAGYSFVFKSSGLKPNKKYRASVWTNSTNARIYYKLNGGSEVLSPAPDAQQKAGSWYLLSFEFQTGGTVTSFETGVKSTSGKAVFDDFRFQPVDGAMVCYVYDPLTFEYPGTATSTPKYEYILDNDNLATKYMYNDRGMLKAVYRESIRQGVQYNGMKIIKMDTVDFRRFYINQ
jgi:hypothetical protein